MVVISISVESAASHQRVIDCAYQQQLGSHRRVRHPGLSSVRRSGTSGVRQGGIISFLCLASAAFG
jgi:hypothetical protein